jgi:hypothetical protein
MSYSFGVRGATRDEVMTKVIAEFDKVVGYQPIHAADREQATAAALAFLLIVPDATEHQDFVLSLSGWASWNEGLVVTAANVNVSASVVPRSTP